MSSSLYLLVNLGAMAIPFAFSWHPKIRFVDQWRSFWPACLITLAFFIAWDVLFTAQGVWGFNESYLVGLSLLGLPLEEWLFFVAIPYACVFTYFVFRTVRNSDAGKVSKAPFCSSSCSVLACAFSTLTMHTQRQPPGLTPSTA